MAAVYSATHRNGKRAAIKILHPEAAMVSDVKARFLREGYLANRVSHPSALSILDDDVDEDGTVFLVMELLQGESLEARWQREERLPVNEVLVVADRVLEVLEAAHAKDIVHRDLKPGNIFIDTSGSIKILDFGIARLQTTAPSSSDTGRSVSLGTPGFMPPEQARGRWNAVDAQSDLWAVGATMFAVLAGRYVHEAPTVNEQLLAAMTEPAPPLAELAPEVPAQLAAIVDTALAFDKADRWPDAASMRVAVQQAYEELVGEDIAAAADLHVPGNPRYRSVHPDAPTLAADEEEPPRETLTTARPVAERDTRVPPDPPGARKRTMLLMVGTAAVALAVGWLLFRPDTSGSSTRSLSKLASPPAAELAEQAYSGIELALAAEDAGSNAEATADAEATAADDAGAGDAGDAGDTAAEAGASEAEAEAKMRRIIRRTFPRVKPKPAPKPKPDSEPIDIFTRRK